MSLKTGRRPHSLVVFQETPKSKLISGIGFGMFGALLIGSAQIIIHDGQGGIHLAAYFADFSSGIAVAIYGLFKAVLWRSGSK